MAPSSDRAPTCLCVRINEPLFANVLFLTLLQGKRTFKILKQITKCTQGSAKVYRGVGNRTGDVSQKYHESLCYMQNILCMLAAKYYKKYPQILVKILKFLDILTITACK